MTHYRTSQIDDVEIRQLIERLTHAIREKDINEAMSVFAPEVVSYDLGPPLRHGGGQTFVDRWTALFAAFEGPLEYEVRDLCIAHREDLAFSYSLNRMAGNLRDGRWSERWLRWTACYRKCTQEWLIIHEHVSVPVDLMTERAMLDLNP